MLITNLVDRKLLINRHRHRRMELKACCKLFWFIFSYFWLSIAMLLSMASSILLGVGSSYTCYLQVQPYEVIDCSVVGPKYLLALLWGCASFILIGITLWILYLICLCRKCLCIVDYARLLKLKWVLRLTLILPDSLCLIRCYALVCGVMMFITVGSSAAVTAMTWSQPFQMLGHCPNITAPIE